MAQDYDKIFKENIEENVKTFARKFLNVDPNRLEEIPDDIQYTLEKKPDFLKKVITESHEPNYILHIEAQTTDPKKMVCRMLVYYAFLYNDYGLEVKQYVLFMGDKENPTMGQHLDHKKLKFEFELIDVRKLDHHPYLNSDSLEDVVFAILCNHKGKESEEIIDQILKRLKLLAKDELDIGKYLTQLEVLSKLRNLQELIIEKIAHMPITYDLETDIRFLQGCEKHQKKVIDKLKQQKKWSNRQIADFLEIPIDRVKDILLGKSAVMKGWMIK